MGEQTLPHRAAGCQACGSLMGKANADRNDAANAGVKVRQHADDEHAPYYVAELQEYRRRADASQTAYLGHHAAVHGTVDPPAAPGVAFLNDHFGRAPSHQLKGVLPANSDMAAMLRAGDTLEDLEARYGVSAGRISTRLNDAGWGRDGQPNHRPHKTLAALAVLVDQPWADRSLCGQTDPEAFFPEKGGSTREAKAVCGRCPVAAECLDYALEHGERFGIWGGLSERERRKLMAPPPPGEIA